MYIIYLKLRQRCYMNSIVLDAPAKVNLSLDVLGKRPDGYHDVRMIMQAIELHDTIYLEEADDGGICVT